MVKAKIGNVYVKCCEIHSVIELNDVFLVSDLVLDEIDAMNELKLAAHLFFARKKNWEFASSC